MFHSSSTLEAIMSRAGDATTSQGDNIASGRGGALSPTSLAPSGSLKRSSTISEIDSHHDTEFYSDYSEESHEIYISEAYYDGPFPNSLTPPRASFLPISPRNTRVTSIHERSDSSPACRVLSASFQCTSTAWRFLKERPRRVLRARAKWDGRLFPFFSRSTTLLSASSPWDRRELISLEDARGRDDIMRRPEGFEMREGADMFVYF